jgi:hypothetical protein
MVPVKNDKTHEARQGKKAADARLSWKFSIRIKTAYMAKRPEVRPGHSSRNFASFGENGEFVLFFENFLHSAKLPWQFSPGVNRAVKSAPP